MKENKPTEGSFAHYEYILYWLVTIALLILAIPVVVLKTAGFLVRSVGTPMKSVKHFLGFVLVVLLCAAGFTAYKIFYPFHIGEATVSIMVEEHDPFSRVSRALKDGKVIADDYLFSRLAIMTGVDKSLIPGRYDFSGKVSLYQVLRKFKTHDIATLLLTIPEGFTIAQIASRLSEQMEIDSAAFVRLANDTAYTEAEYNAWGLEGYLYPETYRLWYGMKVKDIIHVMVSEFERRTAGVFDTPATGGLTREEILILASIIEAEAYFEDEMPVISSVYHNRLRKGMRLQADPTVVYAMGGVDRPLLYRDLEYESPYNTYRHKGLPPGPINSPRLAAIEAAISPDQTDYLYFVADGTGRHVFSTTLRQHNRAKNKAKTVRNPAGSN